MDEIEIINVMVFLREIALVGSAHIVSQRKGTKAQTPLDQKL